MKHKWLQNLDKVFRRIIQLEEYLCVVLLVAMLGICFTAVIKRYFLNSPWSWTDEIQLLLLVIYGYLAISIDIYRDNHVALTGIYNRLPKKARTFLDLFRHALLGVFFCMMAHYGWQIYGVRARKMLTVTHLSQGIVFMAQVICAVLMVLYCVMNFVKTMLDYQEPSADMAEKEEGLD